MSLGSMTFVLHTHMPYCRLAGQWPHGEEWFHEAMLECYLPLVGVFRRCAADGLGGLGVTINVTPILAEQMRDPLMHRHFRTYLADRIERARDDVARFAGTSREAAANFHFRRYSASRSLYEEEINGDIVGALAALERSGHIEIATSAATHGYLPLLDSDRAVRLQVETGVASHVHNFGRAPRAFWLPECAYEPGLERILEEAGISVFFVETHLIQGGRAHGKAIGGAVGPYPPQPGEPEPGPELPPGPGTTFQAYLAGASAVSVLARNERTGEQVWSADWGYPGDAAYREFHKKDDASGLHYWRVTGPGVDLAEKAEYDPEAALQRAREHAHHYVSVARAELDGYRRLEGETGLVLASYDTELYGHWWLEGIPWLEAVLRELAADPEIELLSASEAISRRPARRQIALPEGSWGAGGDHRTWMNEGTAWTWPEIHRRQERATALLTSNGPAERQLARELLLLQASDWQFLMTTGQANDYAVERFRSHCARFDAIADALVSGIGIDQAVGDAAAVDNPFAAIEPLAYADHPLNGASL